MSDFQREKGCCTNECKTNFRLRTRDAVRTVELSELCLLMCPSPRCGQLPAWAQFWVDKVMPLTLRLALYRRMTGLRRGAASSHRGALRTRVSTQLSTRRPCPAAAPIPITRQGPVAKLPPSPLLTPDFYFFQSSDLESTLSTL